VYVADDKNPVSLTSPFNPDSAYAHVAALCYPRRVGTAEERRAARYITRVYDAHGLDWWREPFPLSYYPTEVGNRLAFTLCAALTVVGALVVPVVPLVSAVCWGIAALLVNCPWKLAHYLRSRWPIHTHSANLVATLADAPANPPARVVFMAHYDTKSQFVPTGVRVGLVTTATVMSGLLALAGLLAALGAPQLLAALDLWHGTAVVVLVLAFLVANFSGNCSPGALDNGSGVGALLELARTWRPQPEAPVEVVWVATGAEEVGLNGARAFLERYDSWWDERPTLLINLESVGAGPQLYLAGEPQAYHLARAVAEDLGYEPKMLRVLGAGMDHEPFAARRLTSVSILGDVVRRSFAMHSRRDNLAIIDRAALARAGHLAAQLAWEWAAMHAPADETAAAERPAMPVT
jgi:hypothetical protein